jgi:hypothetical protein
MGVRFRPDPVKIFGWGRLLHRLRSWPQEEDGFGLGPCLGAFMAGWATRKGGRASWPGLERGQELSPRLIKE